jgi:hypothetical protein
MERNTEHGAPKSAESAPGGTAVPAVPVTPGTAVPVPPAARPVPAHRAPVPTTDTGGTSTDSGTGTAGRYRWYHRLGRRYRHTGTGTATAGTSLAVPADGAVQVFGTGTGDLVPAAGYRYNPVGTEATIRAHLRDLPVPAAGTARRHRKAATGTTTEPVTFLGRIFKAISTIFEIAPLAAPLFASGWFTYLVVTDEYGLSQPWPIAVTMVLGLEGVVWTLAKLYEQRLVAGHSTIADRLGILFVVSAIGSLIYWHSMVEAKARTAEARAAAVLAGIDPDFVVAAKADWRGAAVAASMSALGVFVYGRRARWNRRVELEAEGRVDMQALRIGLWQWIVSPWESTWSFRHGMKYRIKRPTDAVRDWRLWKEMGKPKLWPPAMTAGTTGTSTDETVPVPAWMLAELLGNAAGTGTGGDLVGTGYPVPTSPGPAGTGTGGTSYVPVPPASVGGTATRTASGPAGTGARGPGGTGTGTAGDSVTISQYRQRNAHRLDKIRKVLDGTDGRPDWRLAPEADLTLSVITAAGGFSNRTDAAQCKSVLLADRQREGG